MSRRLFHMVTTGLVVIGIGYLIAVAARDLPGQSDDEALVDIGFQLPAGFQDAIVWMTLAATALGAMLLVFAVKRGAPGKGPSLRSLYTLALWLVLLFIIYRYAAPALEETGATFSELSGEIATEAAERSPTIVAASWIVSAVIAAAIAAALIRIAVVAKANDWGLPRSEPDVLELAAAPTRASAITRIEGNSPSARVINAYADFEDGADAAGVGRLDSETSRRHAARVERLAGVDPLDVGSLATGFEQVRYGGSAVTEETADQAESAWARIKGRLGR